MTTTRWNAGSKLLKEVAAWLRERTRGRDYTPTEQLLREARDER
jgi:hypothetical protein